MNSNARAIKLSKQYEGAVSGSWFFTMDPMEPDEEGFDGIALLCTTYDWIGGEARMKYKMETLAELLNASELEEA